MWWFWMIWSSAYVGAPYRYSALGPMQMSEKEAFQMQFELRSKYMTPYIYRWLWEPGDTTWTYDDRTDRVFLASTAA